MEEFKIALIDGREIDGILKSDQPEEIKSDDMKLDTTGQYLSFKKKHQAVPEDIMKRAEWEYYYRLFTDNAWFLLANAEKILSDSRMFLAPVRVQNGLAYVGTSGFWRPTIGVYLEWWLNHKEAAVDKNGNLVWYISGSPLSGRNCCMSVTPDGKHVKTNERSFAAIWRSFVEVNNRYTEAKQRCEAYTLEDVLVKLLGEDYKFRLVELKHEMIEEAMQRENSILQNCYDKLKNKYLNLLDCNKKRQLKQSRDEIMTFYEGYAERNKVIRMLEQAYVKRHNELKHQLRAGTLEEDYHKLLAEAAREYRKQKAHQSALLNKFIIDTFGKNPNKILPTDVVRFAEGKSLLPIKNINI